MKHSFLAVVIFTALVFSGCHKLGKKRCADCPKWNKMEIPKGPLEQI